MNKKQLKALAKEAAQGLKSEENIAALTKLLQQSFYEKALEAELDDCLGYDRHGTKPSTNSRNGYTKPSKKWSMPIRNWKWALNRFIPPPGGTEVIEFEDRLTNYL